MAKLNLFFTCVLAIFRSNNTMEPNISWDEWASSEEWSTKIRSEEDCQWFSSQFIGELTMGLYYARCKFFLRLPFSALMKRKVNGDHNHKINILICLFFFETGDRCWCAFRCSANCWWRTHVEFRMSKIFR